MIVFEGWSAAGKGSRIASLIRWLDPRGFEVFTVQTPSGEERMHPYMWRFWRRTPAAGRVHIFDRSWYRALLSERVKGENRPGDPVREILTFEEQLSDSNVVIVKLFLHISRKEQKKRLSALQKDADTKWRVTKDDWEQNGNYDAYLTGFEQTLEKTDHDRAKWTIIEAENRRFADVKVFETVIEALEEALKKKRNKQKLTESREEAGTNTARESVRSSILAAVDMSEQADAAECRRRLKDAQADLGRLHGAMYKNRVPAAIVFEGWDAAGKGGAIKRLLATLDPRGYEVVPSSAPNDLERAHHYLWRYWNKIPKAGHLTVFDRSWYGRLMVERVEGFCTQEEWRRAFREINDFEEQLVESGTVLIKFWLHIDKDEQLRRFEERVNTPEKQWKITDEDWRNRDKWDDYLKAVDEMLLRTSTTYATWTIVEANQKPYARAKIAETVRDRLRERLK
jgi:polyphosphate:AMP phosphotransferase